MREKEEKEEKCPNYGRKTEKLNVGSRKMREERSGSFVCLVLLTGSPHVALADLTLAVQTGLALNSQGPASFWDGCCAVSQ